LFRGGWPLSPASRPGLLTAGPPGLRLDSTPRMPLCHSERSEESLLRYAVHLYRFANESAPSSCGFIRKAVTAMTRIQAQTGLAQGFFASLRMTQLEAAAEYPSVRCFASPGASWCPLRRVTLLTHVYFVH